MWGILHKYPLTLSGGYFFANIQVSSKIKRVLVYRQSLKKQIVHRGDSVTFLVPECPTDVA